MPATDRVAERLSGAGGDEVVWSRGRHPGDAHARYNVLVRRLVSFEQELERRRFFALRRGLGPDDSTPTAFE